MLVGGIIGDQREPNILIKGAKRTKSEMSRRRHQLKTECWRGLDN